MDRRYEEPRMPEQSSSRHGHLASQSIDEHEPGRVLIDFEALLGFVEDGLRSTGKYHLLPMALPPILILTTLRVASTILIESSLSFLGLGVARSVPTWGGMLSEGRSYLVTQPALTIVPGLAIMITVIGFNLLGDGLNDLLNRRLQDQR